MAKKYQVIALIGKSGAGKDTIARITANRNPDMFHYVVSCTTRPKRDYEEDGRDYNFISIEDFARKAMKGQLLEVAEFRNWFYGTALDNLDIEKINLCVVNPQGAAAMIEDDRLNTTVIWVKAPDAERLQRALKRESNPDCKEICRRFLADEEDFADIDFDYQTLDNTDVDQDSDYAETMCDLLYTEHGLQNLIAHKHGQI